MAHEECAMRSSIKSRILSWFITMLAWMGNGKDHRYSAKGVSMLLQNGDQLAMSTHFPMSRQRKSAWSLMDLTCHSNACWDVSRNHRLMKIDGTSFARYKLASTLRSASTSRKKSRRGKKEHMWCNMSNGNFTKRLPVLRFHRAYCSSRSHLAVSISSCRIGFSRKHCCRMLVSKHTACSSVCVTLATSQHKNVLIRTLVFLHKNVLIRTLEYFLLHYLHFFSYLV